MKLWPVMSERRNQITPGHYNLGCPPGAFGRVDDLWRGTDWLRRSSRTVSQPGPDSAWPTCTKATSTLAGRTSLAEPRWPNYDPTPVRDYAQEQSFISDHARFPAAETALTGRRWCKT